MKKRFKIIGIIIILSFTFVIYKLAIIQLKDKPKYTEYVFESSHNFWYGTSTPRGKIYDRNGNIIVDNEGIKQIYYIKSPKNTTKNRFFRDKAPNILFSRVLLSYIFPVLLFLCN